MINIKYTYLNITKEQWGQAKNNFSFAIGRLNLIVKIHILKKTCFMFVFTMLYCLFIAALYPGSGVVLDVSFPDLCRLSYFVITCWERAELLSLLYVMFSSVFVNFPYGVSGQVWYFLIFAYFLTLYNMFI